MTGPRVAVLGGGVIGLAAAHYLERGGAEVVVVERDRIGGGCSLGNGGWVCPSISTPLPSPELTLGSLASLLRAESPLFIAPRALLPLLPWLWRFRRHCDKRSYRAGVEALAALNAPTAALYRELAGEGVRFERAEDGMLLLHGSEAALARELEELRSLASYGVGPVRALGREELREREPALAGDLVGGLLVESDGHVRPEGLCAGLDAHLAGRGVERIEGFEVRGFDTVSGRVRAASGPDGRVEADVFVVAAGAESGRLTARLGRPLPLQAAKGYSITVEEPAATLRQPAHVAPARMGFTPFEGAIRILGTLELSGINRRLDPRRIANLERAARRYLPGSLEGRARRDWVGMRPATPDGLPAIGRLGTATNAFVATGHQMLGITLAPATGRALAELILTGEAPPELRPFDPGRF